MKVFRYVMKDTVEKVGCILTRRTFCADFGVQNILDLQEKKKNLSNLTFDAGSDTSMSEKLQVCHYN